jgi:hypothetical protein
MAKGKSWNYFEKKNFFVSFCTCIGGFKLGGGGVEGQHLNPQPVLSNQF